MKLLSIVIVSYNSKRFLRQCLVSIYDMNCHINYEVIVVDNNSCDGSCKMVQADFPLVRLIKNQENIGFAKANNIGIGIAKGKYILLLNSDTCVTADALEKLILFLDNHPNVAAVASRLVYPDFTDQGAAKAFPAPINVLFGRRSILTRLFPNNRYSRKYILSRIHRSNEPFEVDWVSGACLMVRKKVIEEVGLLDEKFFMYWEDADLCFQIKKRGWQVYCVPQATIIHYEGRSSHTNISNRLIIEFNKSAYHYYRKNHIRSFYDFMNFIAILGLTLRTLLQLSLNVLRSKKSVGEDRYKEGFYEDM